MTLYLYCAIHYDYYYDEWEITNFYSSSLERAEKTAKEFFVDDPNLILRFLTKVERNYNAN